MLGSVLRVVTAAFFAVSTSQAATCGVWLQQRPQSEVVVPQLPLGPHAALVSWYVQASQEVRVTCMDRDGAFAPGWGVDGVKLNAPGAARPTYRALSLSPMRGLVLLDQELLPSPQHGAQIWGAWFDATQGALASSQPLPLDTSGTSSKLFAACRADSLHAFVGAFVEQPGQQGLQVVRAHAAPGAADALWPSVGVVVDDGLEGTLSELAEDGAGGVFTLMWSDADPQQPFTLFEYRLQHWFADGTRDARWPAVGAVVSGQADAFNVSRMLYPDVDGGVFVSFSEGFSANGASGRTHIMRFAQDGSVVPGWSDRVAIEQPLSGYQLPARIVALDGGVVAVFCEVRDGGVWMSMLDGTGERLPAWSGAAQRIQSHDHDPGFDHVSTIGILELPDTAVFVAWGDPIADASTDKKLSATIWNAQRAHPGTWGLAPTVLCDSTGRVDAVSATMFEGGRVGVGSSRDNVMRFEVRTTLDGATPTLPTLRHLRSVVSGQVVRTEWIGPVDRLDAAELVRAAGEGAFRPHGSFIVTDLRRAISLDTLDVDDRAVRYAIRANVFGRSRVVSDTALVAIGLQQELQLSLAAIQDAGAVRFELQFPCGHGGVEVSLLDVAGRRLSSQVIQPCPGRPEGYSFALPHLPAGLYFVRARASGGERVARTILLR